MSLKSTFCSIQSCRSLRCYTATCLLLKVLVEPHPLTLHGYTLPSLWTYNDNNEGRIIAWRDTGDGEGKDSDGCAAATMMTTTTMAKIWLEQV